MGKKITEVYLLPTPQIILPWQQQQKTSDLTIKKISSTVAS